MKKWKSLWSGPTMTDNVEWPVDLASMAFSFTLMSTGLYALDENDEAWTLCHGVFHTTGYRWWKVDDLVSGAAGRATIETERARRRG